jgi:hypothetical protein
MQPSHSPVSPFLLWSRRAESLSCSTWQIEQHSPYSNYQRRHHRRSKNGCWNGSHPPGERVGWSSMLSIGCRWCSMIQGLPCSSKDLELHHKIIDQAHCSQRSIHLGTNKMYQDLKKISSGQEWREKLQSTCWNVTRVEESKLVT